MTARDRIIQLQNMVGAIPDGSIGNETLTKLQCYLKAPTKAIVAQFMGNIHHETAGFTIHTENMNYSAKRMTEVWPSRYRTIEQARPYANNPRALANHTYGGRMGNIYKDDGFNFRGRGGIQTTGRNSYRALNAIAEDGDDLTITPDLVATKYYWKSAIFYFSNNNLWDLVSDVTNASVERLRRRVNGGIIGLPDTRKWVQHYFALMK